MRTNKQNTRTVIAARSVLRALPAYADSIGFELKNIEWTNNVVLQTFRAAQSALLGQFQTLSRINIAGGDPDASGRLSEAAGGIFLSKNNEKQLNQVLSLCSVVAFVATGLSPTDGDTAGNVSYLISLAAEDDANRIRMGMTANQLASLVLWSNSKQGSKGERWLKKNQSRLEEYLLSKDENWQVWTNWYEDRLVGKPLNEELELAIINLDPEEYWNKGAAVTNKKIQELIEEYTPAQAKPKESSIAKKPTPNQISKPKSYKKSDFDAVIEQLDKYKSSDTWEQGDNLEPLNMSEQELEILKHSLAIAGIASDLPKWSTSMVKQLKGVLAVMEAMTPIIKKLTGPLPKLWNGILKKFQKSLAALRVEELPDGEDE